MKLSKVLFVGLGNMGFPMSLNLQKTQRFDLSVFDLVKSQMDKAFGLGLRPLTSFEHQGLDAVITMLPHYEALEQFYVSEQGFFKLNKKETKRPLLIDCSTIGPIKSKRFFGLSKDNGYDFVDAPVSGGVKRAESASLTFMIGSENNQVYKVS